MTFGCISFVVCVLFIVPMLAMPENRTPFFVIGSIVSLAVWISWVVFFWLPYRRRETKIKGEHPNLSSLDIYGLMLDTKEGKRYSIIGTVGVVIMAVVSLSAFVCAVCVSERSVSPEKIDESKVVWDEPTPQKEPPKPWEEFKQAENLRRIHDSFNSDPLKWATDEERKRLASLIARSANPEETKKKLALAAYYASGDREKMAYLMDQFDQVLETSNGKKTTIDRAYSAMQERVLNGKRLPQNLAQYRRVLAEYERRARFYEFAKWSVVVAVILLVVVGFYLIIKFIGKRIPSWSASYKMMTDQQKIFSGLAGAAVLLLAVAIAVTLGSVKIPYGFFVFLRIVTCGALVGLMLEKLPIWAKLALILLAILYNPVVPIHLGNREVWAWINAGTIPALVAPWAWIWIKKGKI